MSQIILIFNVRFLHDGRVLHTSPEPHDTKEICYSYPEAISHAIVGPAAKSWPVIDNDGAHLPTAPKKKGRKKSVHVVKIGKLQEGMS
jgi:hypothetical protein